MDNKAFYVINLNYQVVKVETHIYSQRRRRDFPLTDVYDLIAAMKQTLPSQLGETSLGQLTLHLNENSESLEPDKSLSDVASGGTAKTALVLKSRME
jgi:hypothetical protein